jgi:hypothetical protein
MSAKRIYIPQDSAERLIVPVESEFIENLKALFGVGLFSELKQRLIPLALDILRISLLGHTHPFETLRGLSDHQWDDLLYNPYTPSLVTDMLDALEKHPKLQSLVQTLRTPEMMRRLQVEWLYEVTVGRFECTVPYLYREDKLLDSWSEFCGTLRDVSLHPYDFCKETAQQAAHLKGSGFSEPARRLFTLSHMAACRKLFVFFSGARETWVGSYTNEYFKLSGSDVDLISSLGQQTERLVLKFGLVDHVYYLKPSMEQLNRFKECVKQQVLVFEIQKKLCPFVSLAGTGLNFNLMAEVFYRVYQPQRIRELQLPVKAELDESFLHQCGLPKSLATQLGFLPLNPDVVEFFASKIEKLPRLGPFLRNPRTERGLLRQRLYRGVLDQLLTAVTQESLLSLCRQWNPQIRTPEGTVMPMISYVEANVKTSKDSAVLGMEHTRRRAIMEDLLQMLLQNTQGWQKAMQQDSFVTDQGRNYFMTILDKAIEEQGSEEMKQVRHRDAYRVVCVVVE